MFEAMLQRRFHDTIRCLSMLNRSEAEAVAANAAARSLRSRLQAVWLAEPAILAAEVHRLAFAAEPNGDWLKRATAALAAGTPRVVWLKQTLAAAGGSAAPSIGTWLELERLEARLPLTRTAWFLRIPDADDFVLKAYRRLLGRDGSPEERAGQAKRARIPFLGRRWLLRKLERSDERKALREAPCVS